MLTSLCSREHRLRITEDSRTRGVRPELTIVSKRNAQQLQLVSIDQRMTPLDKGLTCVELYTLLALAAKMYRAQPFADDNVIYKVGYVASDSRYKLTYKLGRFVVDIFLRSATDYCEHSILVYAVDDTRAARARWEDRDMAWPKSEFL
jgi:hypothetical protein